MFWLNINKNVIAGNRKHGLREPAVRSQRGKYGRPVYGHVVVIKDAQGNEVARIIQSDDGPLLPCGARVAIQALYEPEVIA